MKSLKFYYDLGEPSSHIELSLFKDCVEKSYNNLLKAIKNKNKTVYGVDTGYGSNVNNIQKDKNFIDDQIELLNYLSVGRGDFLDDHIVRRALRIQVLKIGKGFSGTSPEIFSKLWTLSCNEKLPNVPKYGSLGASGDLIPMAHAVFPIFENNPPKGPRDVISLVNTNSMMASLSIELFFKVDEILKSTYDFISYATIGLNSNMEHFDIRGFEMNPQSEIKEVCHNISFRREEICNHLSKKKLFSENVQERYSIRCLPQILGNIIRNLKYCESIIIDETMQVSDNPLVLNDQEFWHGGHFYAIGLATVSDLLKDSCIRIIEFIDRIVLNLMDRKATGLTDNLGVGKNDHLKGLHQLISSYLQRAKGMYFPSALMSFSCEGNNQDVVPCSMNSLNQLDDLLNITKNVVEAGIFCAKRSTYLRFNLDLPDSLSLKSWREGV